MEIAKIYQLQNHLSEYCKSPTYNITDESDQCPMGKRILDLRTDNHAIAVSVENLYFLKVSCFFYKIFDPGIKVFQTFRSAVRIDAF